MSNASGRWSHVLRIRLVSHDIGVLTSKVDRVACLNRKIHFHGNSQEFEDDQEQIVHQLYGHDVQVLEHSHG